jgi:hypothetical protein
LSREKCNRIGKREQFVITKKGLFSIFLVHFQALKATFVEQENKINVKINRWMYGKYLLIFLYDFLYSCFLIVRQGFDSNPLKNAVFEN